MTADVPASGGGRTRSPGAIALIASRPRLIDLESLARAAGLHPDLVRRFVVLGLLDATRDANGELWFTHSSVAAAARLQRLRTGLSLNYAALGVVVDLLDRIAVLEAALRTRSRPDGGRRWTSNA